MERMTTTGQTKDIIYQKNVHEGAGVETKLAEPHQESAECVQAMAFV
jgi:hypothetical protein